MLLRQTDASKRTLSPLCSLTLSLLSREEVKELDISYDWTYTTDYKGTLQRLARVDPRAAVGEPEFAVDNARPVKVEATLERIDLEKLKEREPILWFEDVPLYEDELHDHGVSAMSIKTVGANGDSSRGGLESVLTPLCLLS